MSNDVNDFISNERRDFEFAKMGDLKPGDNPMTWVNHWMDEAIKAQIPEPYAFTLSTVGNTGFPSSRVVYARKITPEGFVFYTNYLSRKGRELEKSNKASALFFWPQHERQIRIEGTIQKTSDKDSDEYFSSRPRNNQLGAWASAQSSELTSRKELETKMKEFDLKYMDKPVPRPPHWGGYAFIPVYFEFWQGRPGRLHDRIAFSKVNSDWNVVRLAP